MSFNIAGKLAFLVGLATFATSVLAQQTQIKTAEVPQGEIVEAHSYPFSSIGKLNNGAGGSCTAVLIAQDYALTAAHCMFLRTTGRYLPAESFHLILGYENQKFQEHLRVAAYYIPPSYQPLKPYESLRSDWALLSLSDRQRPIMHLLPAAELYDGNAHLMAAGYSHRTPYAMTADRECRLVGRAKDDSFIFDSCRAPAGFSGAPLLVSNTENHTISIAGVHVANQLWQSQTIAIVIPIEKIWPDIEPCVRHNNCTFQVIATRKEPTAEQILSGLPNLGLKSRVELTSSP